jgi:hypothetical protein
MDAERQSQLLSPDVVDKTLPDNRPTALQDSSNNAGIWWAKY